MKVATTYDHQSLFLRPVRITQLERLAEGEGVERPLAAGTMIYVSRFVGLQPFSGPTKQEVVIEANTGEDVSTKKVTLADFTKNVGIGGGLAALPLGVLPLAKHATQSQIASQLTNYGFAPDASNQIASAVLNFARSNLGHLCCVFLAGSAITLGTVEALRPDWAWKRKWIVAGTGGVLFLIIGLILIYLSVWGPSAQHGQRVTPTPTKADSKPISP